MKKTIAFALLCYVIGMGILILEPEVSVRNSGIAVSGGVGPTPVAADAFLTTYNPLYSSIDGTDSAEDAQCPIPKEDRVVNRTGTQCVWSSIEMLGRWAEEPKLVNPPLTSRRECQTYSSPSLAARVLGDLDVRFEQTYGDREKGVALIKKAMAEKRGCLFSVPRHAMVLIHYDEDENIVKWVDNSDVSLKVQTTTVDRFHRMWDSWVLVIYADNDIIPRKTGSMNIPIRDRNGVQGEYPDDYIPYRNLSR